MVHGESAGGFGRKSIVKIVSDTERMKNTPIHVCAFVGWPPSSSIIILKNTLN
jgi:hypothetical protein